MQTSVPELTDLSKEPANTFELYGPDARKPGTFADNCLLARRLAERGVRFIQLYHRDWDHHGKSAGGSCRSAARRPTSASAALILDLKQRGMLDDTLVVWGGEFGRTVYCQGRLTADRLRPRSSPPLLHDVDGRRRHQARRHRSARPTITATTSPRIRSTCTICRRRFCIAWASITCG